jgi:hypothetical protein
MGVSINSDDSGGTKVAFPYNPDYVSKIKTVPGHKWHPEGKYWSFPFSKQAEEEVDIDPSLQPSAPQAQGAKREGNPLLDRFRDLIRLKHYSIRTEKSYLPWITQYLAFHHNRDPNRDGGSGDRGLPFPSGS